MKCFSNPGYYVPLPEGHPFPVAKYPELRCHLDECSQAPYLEFERAPLVTWQQVLAAHEASYLDAVSQDQLSRYARNRLGLPHHPRWVERSRLDAGGTLAAAMAALDEGVAWNLGGGTHHAMPAEGLGFCVLNDVAIAVLAMREQQPGLRMLVLDTDAHQGNGTHRILRAVPDVFTLSIHVGANYPAQKEPGDLDVGLPRYVDEGTYLDALDAALVEVSQRFEPELVFWISGVDVLESDRFGQMNLSLDAMTRRDQRVFQAVSDWDAGLVGTLGGGYPKDRSCLPKWHAQSVLESLELC
ncbi:MAG: histone deacetylase [Puniceicoccaceae bacterium]